MAPVPVSLRVPTRLHAVSRSSVLASNSPALLAAVHYWVSAWENGKSNRVVNEREGWFSEVLDLQYDATLLDEMAGEVFSLRKAPYEVVFNDADPVSEVVC